MATLDGVYNEVIRSEDGRFLAAQRATPDGNESGNWVIWNLRTHRVEAEFRTGDGARREAQHMSPDGNWLAAFCSINKDYYIELRELPSGRLVAKTRESLHFLNFSPDSRFLITDDQNPSRRIVLEVPSLKVLWQKQGPAFHPCMSFSQEGNMMFAHDDSGVQAFDSTTGKMRNSVGRPGHSTLRLTTDGRWMCLNQRSSDRQENGWLDRVPWFSRHFQHRPDTVLVLDTEYLRERFRLTDCAIYEAWLCDDGRTLLTTHGELGGHKLRCWDVDAWKPLRWALGVPAGLAAVMVLIAWWRGRRAVAVKAA